MGLKSQIEVEDQMTDILHLVAGTAPDQDLEIQTFHHLAIEEGTVMESETNWIQELQELHQQLLPEALLTKIAATEDLLRI